MAHRLAQRGGRPAVRPGQLDDAGSGPELPLPQQRVEQLACVARIAAGQRERIPQPRSGCRPGVTGDQPGHVLGGERTEAHDDRAASDRRPPQAGNGRPHRYRPAGADEQQWHAVYEPAEPVPRQQAHLVRPLQVVEGHHDRPFRGQPIDHCQEPLDRGRNRIPPAVRATARFVRPGAGRLGRARGGFATQQRDDIGGRIGTKPVNQGTQWKPLTQFVANGSIDLAGDSCRFGDRRID